MIEECRVLRHGGLLAPLQCLAGAQGGRSAAPPRLSCDFPRWLMTQALASFKGFYARTMMKILIFMADLVSSCFLSFFGTSSPSLDSELFIRQPEFSLVVQVIILIGNNEGKTTFRRVFLSLNGKKKKRINTIFKISRYNHNKNYNANDKPYFPFVEATQFLQRSTECCDPIYFCNIFRDAVILNTCTLQPHRLLWLWSPRLLLFRETGRVKGKGIWKFTQ